MGKKHKKHHRKRNEDKVSKVEEPPIKLVLKVANVDSKSTEGKKKKHDSPSEHRIKEHSNKKKKKRSSSKERKKRKHENGDAESSSHAEVYHEKSKKKMRLDETGQQETPIIKKIHIKPIEPPKEHKRIKTIYQGGDPTSVILCLGNLHQTLQRKDVNGFFAFPVNDVIAPAYSSIISKPMDFSTMKSKIDRNVYQSLQDYKDDFYLMCNNAMIYNTSDTIYYKAAKKLQQIGAKIMSDEKFRNLYKAMGLPQEDNCSKKTDEKSSEELIDVDTVDNSASTMLLASSKKKEHRPRKKNTVGQKLQAKVEEAAMKAAERLAKKCPHSNIGFLRKDPDGNTSLAILNPGSVDGVRNLPVNLGTYTGKLTSGSVSTNLYQEDKKNKAMPVTYLKYGPFSSFSPSYDSSNATITKEDSDLLYHTYGDSTGVYYSQSIQAFVKDNIFAKNFVDCLLDSLTSGAHSKLMARLKEKLLAEEEEEFRKKEELRKTQEMIKSKKEQIKVEKQESASLKNIDFNALLSLEKDGIDMSFLQTSKNESKVIVKKEIQQQLDTTGELLSKLDEAQSERLSQSNDTMNGATPKLALQPSETEQNIAEKVTEKLTKLTSQVPPETVADIDGVRKALGVGDITRKSAEQEEMEVQLAAEAIETVFNETTTIDDLDKVICEAAREVEDAMGLDVLDNLTATLDDVKRMQGSL